MKEPCQNCVPNYVLTLKTPHKTCTVALYEEDMMLHEVLDELVTPVLEGSGYVVQPGHIDIFHREE
tara:strand:+ start:148 stop:345 length:198 start_codon:yes stop_codon:yes gene_type:complete